MNGNKLRVKCANCGMTYDITILNYTGIGPDEIRGKCPRCGSNAFDRLDKDHTRWK